MGALITDAFIEWYQGEVGKVAYDAWLPRHPNEHATLKRSWDAILRTFGGHVSDLDPSVEDAADAYLSGALDGTLPDGSCPDGYVVPVPPYLCEKIATPERAALVTEYGSDRTLTLTRPTLRKHNALHRRSSHLPEYLCNNAATKSLCHCSSRPADTAPTPHPRHPASSASLTS